LNQADKGAREKEMQTLKLRSKNAEELVVALIGYNRAHGDWGEHQLKSILDMVGMVEGEHYEMQAAGKGEDGQNLRPDCVLRMPPNRRIIIDSKMSLTSYIAYANEESPDRRRELLSRHVLSVRRHIDELRRKEYHKIGASGFDFVFMFIPNESAFIAALQADPAIYDAAYMDGIAIATPISILPILRTIQGIMNMDKRNRNAEEIARVAGRLYDKLAGFIDNMRRIDRSLSSARSSYDDAFRQLSDGRGSAMSIAEDMRRLGAKTAKNIGGDTVAAIGEDADEPRE
jgi:DNA recombination protein RmuC